MERDGMKWNDVLCRDTFQQHFEGDRYIIQGVSVNGTNKCSLFAKHALCTFSFARSVSQRIAWRQKRTLFHVTAIACVQNVNVTTILVLGITCTSRSSRDSCSTAAVASAQSSFLSFFLLTLALSFLVATAWILARLHLTSNSSLGLFVKVEPPLVEGFSTSHCEPLAPESAGDDVARRLASTPTCIVTVSTAVDGLASRAASTLSCAASWSAGVTAAEEERTGAVVKPARDDFQPF